MTSESASAQVNLRVPEAVVDDLVEEVRRIVAEGRGTY